MDKLIKIDEKYFIRPDIRCWELVTFKIQVSKKTGEEKKRKISHGYFTTLESVLNKLLTLKVKDNIEGEVSLTDLRDAIINAREEVKEIGKRIVI